MLNENNDAPNPEGEADIPLHPTNGDLLASRSEAGLPPGSTKISGDNESNSIPPGSNAEHPNASVEPQEQAAFQLPEDASVVPEESTDFRALGAALAGGVKEADLDAFLAALPPQQNWLIGKYLVIPSGHLSIDAGSWICIGIAVRHGRLYLQGWELVEICGGPDGQLVLIKVIPERFCSLLEGFGYKVMALRTDKNGAIRLKIARLSISMAKQMVNTSAARELPPRIETIIRCPAVTIDFNGKPVYLKQGFNKLQRTFVSDPIQPERVTVEDASRALLELISDFNFRTPGDRARAVAWLITPSLWLGGLLKNARLPFFLAEADRSQSGKTLLIGGIATVYGEDPTVFAQRKHGVGGTGEFFCSALLKARPFILFDNIRWELDCPEIEAFFTAPSGRFSARVPHRDSIEDNTGRYFIFGSSNGFKSEQADLRNRTSIVQLLQRPKAYRFRHSRDHWLAHIRLRQPFYLGCVCAIAAAWVEAGRPSTASTGHYLREWCQALDWIILTYFKGPGVGGVTDNEVSRMGGEINEGSGEDDGDPLPTLF